ncbi:peptidoglycan recognition protein family protein [Nocardiopsis ganjiahuensis]|uniref:peptidoglycan recognition protein family protein n=1 Tax=Nocardiopsis ganjiahuensis TaxID=239984 RepID=UPI00034919A9|nr:N-acetylmuramoyl-L-alanine amidase [Nocardiopsis ganjiahuensis]
MTIDYPRTYFGWSSTSPADYATPRSGLVIHYNGDATNLTSHAGCVSYWKGVRNSHVNGNGWADLGYSFGISVDGHIFEGRGLTRYQAAQGTTAGNRDWYSVSLMIGGSERPTAAQIEGVRRLRAWLMAEHGVSGTVRGHRDFISTSCPGSPLYALVTDGTFTKPPGAITTEVSDMLGLKKGDSGERVKLLQLKLKNAGFSDVVGTIDADYGPATAEAVRQARASVGSAAGAGWGDRMTPDACEQVDRAFARRQAEIMIGRADLSTGGSSGDLPATETVAVSGQLTVKR